MYTYIAVTLFDFLAHLLAAEQWQWIPVQVLATVVLLVAEQWQCIPAQVLATVVILVAEQQLYILAQDLAVKVPLVAVDVPLASVLVLNC